VDALLASEPFVAMISRHGRARVRRYLRMHIQEVRSQISGLAEPWDLKDPGEWARGVAAFLADDEAASLQPVINATGVVLHTNLGRAPLARRAMVAMAKAARGYTNLEYDLVEGHRGSRYEHCAGLFAELTGAEAALVVNNAAAALTLALNTVALGGAVAVSRGELVEIGGGFRIPEILERSGARLLEVGSTNRTRASDYQAAVDEDPVAAVLKVHRSNFRMSGFTEEASLPELAEIARRAGIPLIHDLGSGLFVEASELGLPDEPRPHQSLAAGADLVVVSGDKLFGGPQAGVVVGRAELVEDLRRNPLCRALRVDKVTLAGLEATARLYREPDRAMEGIPTLRMLRETDASLRSRSAELEDALRTGGLTGAKAGPSEGAVGGGTFPEVALPSWAVRVPVPDPDQAAHVLRRGRPPVVGRVEDDRLVLDVRTVQPWEMDALVRAVVGALVGDR
jgi:L-seryl-tRNA(Ser) seleniumtransferase